MHGTNCFQTGDLVELDTRKEILRRCSTNACKNKEKKMKTNINVFFQKFFEKKEIEAIYKKINNEVNREMRENTVDYELVLEKIFERELVNIEGFCTC